LPGVGPGRMVGAPAFPSAAGTAVAVPAPRSGRSTGYTQVTILSRVQLAVQLAVEHHTELLLVQAEPRLGTAPATCPSSSSSSSISPAGWSGRAARSAALRLRRYSSSFQARMTSRCDMLSSVLGSMSRLFALS